MRRGFIQKLSHYPSKDATHIKPLKANRITAPEKCLFNITIETNSVDPGQTAPEQSDLGPHYCLRGFKSWSDQTFRDMRFKGLYMWVQCVYGKDFNEKHACLRDPNNLLTLRQIINGTWFPFFSRWNSRTAHTDLPKALKRDSIYNIDALF